MCIGRWCGGIVMEVYLCAVAGYQDRVPRFEGIFKLAGIPAGRQADRREGGLESIVPVEILSRFRCLLIALPVQYRIIELPAV